VKLLPFKTAKTLKCAWNLTGYNIELNFYRTTAIKTINAFRTACEMLFKRKKAHAESACAKIF